MSSIKVLIFIFAMGRALLPASAFAKPISLPHASAHMTGVSLVNCSSDKCIKIESAQASEGFIVNGVSFGSASLTLSESKTGRQQVYSTNNIFLDYSSNRLYVEGLNGDPRQEAIYELTTGQFKKF